MQLVDTHCHIHFPDYELDAEEVRQNAAAEGVEGLICVGCTLEDSREAVEFAQAHDRVWASIGLHPHEGSVYVNDDNALTEFRSLATKNKVVAIGETGLDYHYNHSPKEDQQKLLRFQLGLAQEHDLPLIFHVRDAFDDFWPIFDEFSASGRPIRGVVHSFTGNIAVLQEILSRGLYVGLNGIMTFTKDQNQLLMAKTVELDRLLLETDAPFLTPNPLRGKICEPKHMLLTARFLADIRGEPLERLATATTENAQQLFGIQL